MRILILTAVASLIAACTPANPSGPTVEPTPRTCPEGEPDCGPAGV